VVAQVERAAALALAVAQAMLFYITEPLFYYLIRSFLLLQESCVLALCLHSYMTQLIAQCYTCAPSVFRSLKFFKDLLAHN